MVSKSKNLYCFLVIVVVITIVLYFYLKDDSKFSSVKYLQQYESKFHQYHHGNQNKQYKILPIVAETTLRKNRALSHHDRDVFKYISGHVTDDNITDKWRKIKEILQRESKNEVDLDLIEEQAINRSMEYCNAPENLKVGQEGKVSNIFTLRSIHIVIRHGDRSPMYKLPNQDTPQLSCILNPSDTVIHKDLVQSFIFATTRSGSHIPYGQKYGSYPRQKTCMGAELTGKGITQHLVNGAILREVYVNEHKLIGEKLQVSDLKVKSTDYSRTYQSALAFMHGLLPNMNLSELPIQISNFINFCDVNSRSESCSCPIMSQLREFSKKEEIKMKSNLTSFLITAVKHEVATIYGMNVHHVPWVGDIVEVLMGYVCHGLPLPCTHPSQIQRRASNDRSRCIQMPLIGKMWQYLDMRSQIAMKGHAEQKYNILFIYPLLKDIAQQLLNLSEGLYSPKVTLYSGHDLTMTPLIKALGIYNGHWVPYASRLIIEMYSSSNTQFFVRVLYNGKDLSDAMKFCKSHLVHNMCPLQYFVDFAFNEVFRIFKNTNYRHICKS